MLDRDRMQALCRETYKSLVLEIRDLDEQIAVLQVKLQPIVENRKALINHREQFKKILLDMGDTLPFNHETEIPF